jgi:hypothetical protein
LGLLPRHLSDADGGAVEDLVAVHCASSSIRRGMIMYE